jgi:Uma2 family endonuclease
MSQETLQEAPYGRWPFAVVWTRDDCAKLEAVGVLNYRYELIEGVIYRKMGQNLLHSRAVSLLLEYLYGFLRAAFIHSQAPIDVRPEDNPTNSPEPDVTVLSVPASTLTANPTPAQIALVVEVSDSTLAFDLTVKAGLYARAEISEYWVVDLPNRAVHVHTAPQNGQYQSVITCPDTSTIAPLAAPANPIPVAQILP